MSNSEKSWVEGYYEPESGSLQHGLSQQRACPLLIIDDFGMRKLPLTAAGDLLEIVMRRYAPARR